MNPEAAEDQLKLILQRFLKLVGVTEVGRVIEGRAFERLVWANAGVARDFLQMFARALEHASEKGRRKITLTDANLAIGEFGDQKMRELEQDAQNDKSQLEQCLAYIEKYCLEGTRGTGGSKTNGFLIRNDSSPEYRAGLSRVLCKRPHFF